MTAIIPACEGINRRWRVVPVEGDAMAPALAWPDHIYLDAAVTRWAGDGIYMLDGPDLRRVTWCGLGRVLVAPENKHYSTYAMTYADFNDACLGKVMAVAKVLDHAAYEALRRAAGRAAGDAR